MDFLIDESFGENEKSVLFKL